MAYTTTVITNPTPTLLTPEAAAALSIKVASVFTPRAPVSTHALFAGRWPEINALVDGVAQVGLHIVLFGERGVGKTSLANVIPVLLKFFDETASPSPEPRIVAWVNANTTDTSSSIWSKAFNQITWNEDAPALGFRPQPGQRIVSLVEAYGLGDVLSIEDVRRTLSYMPGCVFVVDEFDRLARKHAADFTDLIKALSDGGTPATVVLVGVAATVDGLVKDHASIKRALIQIPLSRMKLADLREIIEKAEKSLGVVFDSVAGERTAMMSQGLPHYTHHIALLAVREACRRFSGVIEPKDVSVAFEQAVKQADQTIAKGYTDATHSAQPDALYTQVLLACALTAARDADSGGYFQPASVVEPLTLTLKRARPVEISTFNKHLSDLCEEKRGSVLERIGHVRSFRYRFRDPLMVPYVLMQGVAARTVTADELETFMNSGLA